MLSVVCPVYNEAENIGNLFSQLKEKISVPMEVLVIYDREDDNTIPAVQDIASNYPFEIRLIKNRFGAGALNAIKSGFLEFRNEAVLVVMADLSDNLSIVDEMYHMIADEGFDIVCGSRYMPSGRQTGGPLLKKTISRLAGVSLHYLAGLPTHDATNSFKMYRGELLKNIEIESQGGFELGIELVVKTFVRGGRIAELPSTWTDRVTGKSRFRMWKWMPSYLRWYFYALRKHKEPTKLASSYQTTQTG
jgi:glycosyltransferase involved in cell wall biosynthesis